jgi:hypothetical protein
MVKESEKPPATTTLSTYTFDTGKSGCNPSTSICVKWERPDETEMQSRGRGIAFRNTENEHYAEVKTQGYVSNTAITIIHNDQEARATLGDGSPGGNTVNIKQNNGVLRRAQP